MNDPVVKRIGILGSTGSIGRQALEVIRSQPDHFTVELLTAHRNADLLIEQAKAFRPDSVVIGDESAYARVQRELDPLDIKVFTGSDAVTQLLGVKKPDLLLTAMVGFAGLAPTLAAVRNGTDLALANKETLVVAGDLITAEARRSGARIIPVDSEHSAIFQCLQGEYQNRIEKIYLTASGGPFRGRKAASLMAVTPQEALRHPNWNMGSKITIDSATLMNKGLEMIEARWLFGLDPGRIAVVVHPQSVIHSIVQFEDGSMKAQMGLPDMKLPIHYALSYPQRLPSSLPRFSFADFPALAFEDADTETFPSLLLARQAMERGGNMPCIMNAANEAAVAAFLEGRIPFLQIPAVVETCMRRSDWMEKPALADYEETHRKVLELAEAVIAGKKLINSRT